MKTISMLLLLHHYHHLLEYFYFIFKTSLWCFASHVEIIVFMQWICPGFYVGCCISTFYVSLMSDDWPCNRLTNCFSCQRRRRRRRLRRCWYFTRKWQMTWSTSIGGSEQVSPKFCFTTSSSRDGHLKIRFVFTSIKFSIVKPKHINVVSLLLSIDRMN